MELELLRDYLVRFYEQRLGLFGPGPQALGWASQERQNRHYQAMLSALREDSLEGSRVLDYGCGMGDLLAFLKGRGVRVHYTGVDINPAFVRIAQGRHPEATFMVLDASSQEPPGEFDYTFVCGTFNNNLQGMKEVALRVIGRLWGCTRRALLFNAPSAKARDKDPQLCYYEPQEVLEFAQALGRAVLREDLLEEELVLRLSR
jgi:SAM-dependent methyltransferase